MSKDDLGDRMKAYERRETGRTLFTTLPIYARIDGRGFSKFTKGMEKPFDARMTRAMQFVTQELVEQTGATIGYVQSDEISLLWKAPSHEQTTFFDGRITKLTSVLASLAAALMAKAIRGWQPYEDRLPHFDARVIQLPDDTEAANMILWRVLDAQRNAVTSATRAEFSPRQMHGKTVKQMLAMLEEAGVDYEAYPEESRHGTFIRRYEVEREMTPQERDAIPEPYRPMPGTLVSRSQLTNFSLPNMLDVINRTDFVMNGAEPLRSAL